MESHKRTLGILHLVIGIVNVLVLLLFMLLSSALIPFIVSRANHGDMSPLNWLMPLAYVILGIPIVFVAFPSIIGGIALLKDKAWGMPLLLMVGCIRLLSFPVGTALGFYTIWIYFENKKQI